MTPADAVTALAALAEPVAAVEMAAYHKVTRQYLGVRVPEIDRLAKDWRDVITLDERLALAQGLWQSDIHEARIAAAKLLTQARIRPDDAGAWQLIAAWVPDFDGWAIADHVCIAGQKRLMANPERVAEVADWSRSDHMWTRRAALVITLPWAKMNFPKAGDLAIREQVLGWCAAYVPDRDWFMQKAIAWWLRDLSRHDPARVLAFLDAHGAAMKAFARKEASRHLNLTPSRTDMVPIDDETALEGSGNA